jgi:predicted metalloprotease with PDZ domain
MAESVFDTYDETMGGPPRPAPGESSERVLTIINEADVTDGEVIGSHINILLEPDPDPMGQLFSTFGFAHELFHLWNGKSIRSSGSEDWFSEGFTNYYALKALHEAGMLDEASFLGVLGGIFYQRYVGDEGYGELSMREAVEIDKDGHWGLIYAGGLFTAICQDVEIRLSTANRRSIDDVMRAMYERYAGSSDEYGAADVEREIAGLSEHDPTAFFERHVMGKEPIPIAACLSRIGLEVDAVDGRLQIARPADLGADRAAMLAGMLGDR